MRILNAKPPIWEKAARLFGLKNGDPIFFTYGDTIYNPAGAQLTPDLIVHEECHGEQQDMHPDVAKIWWERYCHDTEFRIEQEAEAYGAQYRWLCRRDRDRNAQARHLHQLAAMLASPMYGSAIGHADAKKKILDYAKNDFPDD